jgi:capsular exopolysaccharide synthesis family protein
LGDQGLSTILWRGKWLVVASVAVGVVLAVVATKTSAKVYQANSIIQVDTGTASGAANLNPAEVQLANQNLASTYSTLITDRGFLAEIQPHIYGGRLSTPELERRLSAHAITGTSLVKLSAQGPSPSDARRLAGEVATQFVKSLQRGAIKATGVLQQQVQLQINQLSSRIASLRRSGASTDEIASLVGARAELVRQLAAITANQIAAGNSVSITAPPTGPAGPVQPRPVLNLLAGLLVGLLVGVLLAWLRARLDRGLHSSQEAEELLEVPTLATVPVRRRYSSDDPVLGEAFDVLRTNLAFLSHDRALRVVALSSFNPREGKSSTVEGLAHAAVRGGLDVLMIDGDVRTRSLSDRLGHGAGPGLTTAIVGAVDVDDAIIPLAPQLSLLPSGPTPPNPPSLLSSNAMRKLLDSLRERYSMILIDTPPVAHLADASILASMADGVIAVARVGVTKRADLPAFAAALRQVPTPVVGVVVLNHRQIDDTYYPAVSRGLGVAPPTEPRPAPADTVETL